MSDVLGTTEAGEPLALDLDRLIGTHACVVANSGGGKSGLIRRLLETTHGRVQHIVLDIEDEFYTLRERFDYVIAGGDGGDAPITIDSAEGLALATLQHGFSLIVQLNDLGASAPQFVGRFLSAMISAPKQLWRPVLVVVDEAQVFAPQDGATAATAGMKALIAQGRKRGFTAVYASQRIAKISADIRGGINNWLLGRVGQSLDRRAVADQLGFANSSAEARDLQGLPDRSFWGFGPAIAKEPVLFRVADVTTTPVRPGQAKLPTPPPPEALRAILEGIAASTVEQKLDTAMAAYDAGAEVGQLLVERDARIAELEAELAALRAEHEQLLGIDAECDRYQTGLGAIEQLVADVRAGRGPFAIDAPAASATSLGVTAGETAPSGAGVEAFIAAAKTPRGAVVRVGGQPRPDPAGKPHAMALKMVEKMDALAPARLTWRQLSSLLGYSPDGGYFRAGKRDALERGLLSANDQYVWSAKPGGAPLDRAAAFDLWLSILPEPAPKMMMVLAGGTRGLSKQELADELGYSTSGGHFRKGLALMRQNGVSVETGENVRLAEPLPGEAA
ncbi:MAG TPA: DUF87 domain-containing protein [Allosphingosinicella sp.]|jgi:hypothetical protein